MNIRFVLAQIANEMDLLGMHDEANTVDGVLQGLPEDIEQDVSPESVLQNPNIGQIMQYARGWVNDCQWEDQEEIDSYSDLKILQGIQRHYDGGLAQFLKDNLV